MDRCFLTLSSMLILSSLFRGAKLHIIFQMAKVETLKLLHITPKNNIEQLFRVFDLEKTSAEKGCP